MYARHRNSRVFKRLVKSISGVNSSCAGTKGGSPFPESTFVPVAEACHEPTGCNQCALSIARGFIEPLQPGDTSCGQKSGNELFPSGSSSAGRGRPRQPRGKRPKADQTCNHYKFMTVQVCWNAPVLKITRVFCRVENFLLYWIPQPFARNGF